MGGSIVHFGEMNKRPANSKLYSARDERWPISADVVFGKAGDAFKGIGERSIASSFGGSCSKVFTGSPAFLHSSANTYGQWHAGHIEIRLRCSRVCYFFFCHTLGWVWQSFFKVPRWKIVQSNARISAAIPVAIRFRGNLFLYWNDTTQLSC